MERLAPITLFWLAAAGLMIAQDPAQAPKPEEITRVEGKVIDSATNVPLRKVNILLQPMSRSAGAGPQSPQGPLGTQTDAEGKFVVEGAPPGTYMVVAEKAGYVPTRMGGRSMWSQGSRISLSEGQKLSGITIRLDPAGAISGRVLDDEGDPLSGCSVQLLQRRFYNGRRQWMNMQGSGAGNLGEYKISGLTPGKYLIVANYQMRMSFGDPTKAKEALAPTFYPDALEAESATQIDVVAGQEVSGMDIRMRKVPVRSVKGKVAGTGNMREIRLMLQPLMRDGQPSMNFGGMGGGAMTREDGSFEIHQVRPGSYQITAMRMSQGGPPGMIGRSTVEVGDTDVDGVMVTMVEPFRLEGKVTLVTKEELRKDNIRLQLIPANPTTMFTGRAMSQTKEDGSFTMEGVTPGEYILLASGLSVPSYVKSINMGGQEIDGETPASFAGPATLTVTISTEGGIVDGAVLLEQPPQQQQPEAPEQPSAVVVMSPESVSSLTASNPMSQRQVTTLTLDQNGHFERKSVRPGKYRLWALTAASDDTMQELMGSPALRKELESEGTAVDVRENARSTVQLKPIPADRLQKARERAAIE